MKILLILSLIMVPQITCASETYLSPRDMTRIEAMVNIILQQNTNTSSTSTTPEIKVDELTGLRMFDTIETSTTTLTIEAPMIKLWQSLGGLRTNLKKGMKGNEVVILQGILSAYIPDFRNTYISGFFGDKTKNALKQFQSLYKIDPTGHVGPKTKELVNQKYLSDLCPQKKDDYRILENLGRKTSIESDYVPPELVTLSARIRTAGVVCLSKEPADMLEKMVLDAKKDGHELIILSGYRRYEVQKLLKEWNSKNNIKEDLDEAIGLAEAGHSEHQLGTAVDISGKSLKYIGPSTTFGNTREGLWLQKNSYTYGYIMSYPKGKEDITGYIYEPWHFRYVGIDMAEKIYKENTTIQEFLNKRDSSTSQN